MRAVLWRSRAVALALVFAAAGFCYAVGTCGVTGPSAGARAVGSGTPLRFTNPPVAARPSEYDLGDATFGSIITRYITAEGGLKPYRFTSAGPQSLVNVLEGYPTTLQLGLSGVLAGSLPGRPMDPVTKQALPFPSHTYSDGSGPAGFCFQVQVQDAKGTNPEKQTGLFNLFLFDGGLFRFAMDKLPDAGLAASYLAKIDVLGGLGAVTFKVLGVVDATGASMNQNDLGIFVTPDGTVIGRPLVLGTFSMLVQCKDGAGNTAASRFGTGLNQAFTIIVRDEAVTSTDLTTEQCSIRGDGNSFGRDVLRYKGYINALGQDNFQLLNSDFSFRVGGAGFSCRLDGKGQFSGVLPRDNSKVKVKVNAAKGLLDITISNGSLTAGLEAYDLTDGLTRRPVQVTVGDAVASSEVLDFKTRVSGARYQLDYRLGRAGRRGATFAGTKADGVKRLKVDSQRFVGMLETNVISSKATAIPQAIRAPSFGNVFFPLGLDLTRGTGDAPFSGEHAKRIFGLKEQYRDAPPKR
ncbi:MAG: hypothetical protein NTW87_15565 [Planctomycetota bacterium]|nr:hypothetical protein [Planctomycetota bacterium]